MYSVCLAEDFFLSFSVEQSEHAVVISTSLSLYLVFDSDDNGGDDPARLMHTVAGGGGDGDGNGGGDGSPTMLHHLSAPAYCCLSLSVSELHLFTSKKKKKRLSIFFLEP